jgi:hypothetical protein
MLRSFFFLLNTFFCFISVFFSTLYAQEPYCCYEQEESCCEELSLNRWEFYIGPDWFNLNRRREGGTKQNGNIYGLRAGFDRLKCFGWYIGAEVDYSSGTLKGHDRRGRSLKSQYTESMIEGKVGYTLQMRTGFQFSITPFIGLGYSVERNNFTDPSPLPIHFKTRYTYVETGFLSWMHLCEQWELGLNFKTKYPLSPKCFVSNDPVQEPMLQRIGDELFYRLELPITYRLNSEYNFAVRANPYYEYRKYGQHFNFPADFFETQFNIYGLTIEFIYRL